MELESEIRAHAVQRNLKPLGDIRNIVAVASGKGGVGKSTVAVNLALAWAAQGARVGVLDADIYGPSQPLMLGLTGQRPSSPDGKHLQPLVGHGVTAMSIGFLVDAEQPMVWRGPMVTQALTQLLEQTQWGTLDYLVVDMPPGTGDIQLTLAQRVPVAGAVIVTTPQDIALADARKGLKMFEKVSVPVLGIVENMSVHVCSNCGHSEHIFGAGGGARMAQEYGVRLLGELPLDAHIREEADGGRPTVVAAPDSPRARPYFEMARRTAAALALRRVIAAACFRRSWSKRPDALFRRPAQEIALAGRRVRLRYSRSILTGGLSHAGAFARAGRNLMSIKSDNWIRRMAREHAMIEPFEPGQVREVNGRRIVSYGTSSYGYDVRCASEFKIFTNINSTIVDPKNFDEKSFVDFSGDVCIIPPNSFALARTVEYFRVPRNVLIITVGKSTFARCGVIVNVTPLEPEWEGHVTLEFSNTTPLPAKIYANEGVAQMLFFESDEVCSTSYRDRGGKYRASAA